ncbi:4-(cytidine 5'-diphospho)-2-C-methyl-D-erythritol kinase [Adlercreutzia murintestinalis]|uniref:4-(cytidine 5'-diphospho)-2-C-methyl-D-erythritol kinase n=1 Tax=Adlercreutzia murintestinalis TaxID=2941325 RepID=UPI0020423244|nr:hypothetical protein [Adlercreutzia murintestinalis]
MDMLNVDMMAEARNAQLSADELLGPGALKAVAPAKVNLFLGVGTKRPDGYHTLVSVFHALALHDTLHFKRQAADAQVAQVREKVQAVEACAAEADAEVDASGVDAAEADALAAEADEAEVGEAKVSKAKVSKTDAAKADAPAHAACSLPPQTALVGPAKNLLVTVFSADKTQATVRSLDVPAAQNLVVRAIDALAHCVGYHADEHIVIHIEKNIPTQAGLGGGSADAAATLLAMARFWGVAPDCPTLREVAAGLGADVAFFLEGGCTLMEGTGERLKTHLDPAKLPVVLVRTPEGVSTAQAYARFDENPTSVPADLLAQAEDAADAAQVPLFNNLTPAAESLVPQLAVVRAWLADQLAAAGVADPAARVLLCGSGSCTFAIADSFAQASGISAAACAQGWWSRPTTLSRLKATLV